MTEHDLTRPRWGHNLNITGWDRDTKAGKGLCWLTPAPKEGDIFVVPSENGSMRLVVTGARWLSNVDDMFAVELEAEATYLERVAAND